MANMRSAVSRLSREHARPRNTLTTAAGILRRRQLGGATKQEQRPRASQLDGRSAAPRGMLAWTVSNSISAGTIQWPFASPSPESTATARSGSGLSIVWCIVTYGKGITGQYRTLGIRAASCAASTAAPTRRQKHRSERDSVADA